MSALYAQFLQGIGSVPAWGFSPSRDLQASAPLPPLAENATSRNFLVLGSGDIRHLLHTIAVRRRHPDVPLKFYIQEKNIETLARHMLLFAVIFDNTLTPQECCETFLELYGNSLIRKRTAVYLEEKARQLIRHFSHDEGPLVGFFDVSHLKYKERDELEDVFKTWMMNVDFDMQQAREQRMRAYYNDRYDVRANLMDWDRHMKLDKKDHAAIIHPILWKQWRETGVAFEVRQSSYTEPNRSLASLTEGRDRGRHVLVRGKSVLRRGFWGDIVQSPYLAFGIESEDGSLFKKANQTFTKSCWDVSERNILAFLHEMSTGTPYPLAETEGPAPPPSEEIKPLPKVEEVSDEEAAEIEAAAGGEKAVAVSQTASEDGGPVRQVVVPKDVKVVLLLGEPTIMTGKQKYTHTFHHAYVSNNHVHNVSHLTDLLADDAVVDVETARFLLDIRPEAQVAFAQKVVETASSVLGATRYPLQGAASLEDSTHLTFVFNRAESNAKKAAAVAKQNDAVGELADAVDAQSIIDGNRDS